MQMHIFESPEHLMKSSSCLVQKDLCFTWYESATKFQKFWMKDKRIQKYVMCCLHLIILVLGEMERNGK